MMERGLRFSQIRVRVRVGSKLDLGWVQEWIENSSELDHRRIGIGSKLHWVGLEVD